MCLLLFCLFSTRCNTSQFWDLGNFFIILIFTFCYFYLGETWHHLLCVTLWDACLPDGVLGKVCSSAVTLCVCSLQGLVELPWTVPEHNAFQSLSSCVHSQNKKQVKQLSIGDFPQTNKQISNLQWSVGRRKGDVKGSGVGKEVLPFRSARTGKHKYHSIILELMSLRYIGVQHLVKTRRYPSPLSPLGSCYKVQRGCDLALN